LHYLKLRVTPGYSESVSFYLMFTDGLTTLGKDVPKVIEAPIYIFSSDEMVNFSLLKNIAKKSGGGILHNALPINKIFQSFLI
jgi:hypothetical protein